MPKAKKGKKKLLQQTINKMSAFEDKMKGKWNVVKGKLKQKYGDLTEDDLEYIEGKEDEFVGNLQKKTGEAKASIKEFIANVEK